jgi:hypothetical protein
MRQPRGVEILDSVTAKALDSEDYKRRLLDDPVKVLADEGLTIPEDVTVVIHENTGDTIHLVLPSQLVETITLGEVDLTIVANHTGGM